MKLPCFICTLLCLVSVAHAAPPPPNLMPIRGNVWTTNVPPVRLTNAQELLQTGILTVDVPGAATNDWGHAGITQLIRGSVLMTSMAGTNASIAGFDTNGYLGKASASFSDGTNTTVVQLGPFVPLRIPVANGTNTLTDGPLSIPLAGSPDVIADGKIYFGVDLTNAIFRDGRALVITNTSSSISFGPNASGQMTISADNGGAAVVLWNGALVPSGGTIVDLSGPNFSDQWRDFGMNGQFMIGGYKSGLDYSRLLADHTGVGGSVIFNSQASGAGAGPAVDFLFQSNSVTVAKIAANSGYTGSGVNFLSDDGTFRAAVGGGTNTAVVQLGPFTINRIPVADGTNTLTDGPLSIPIAGSTNVTFDGQIFFTSGNAVSNSFVREADTLVYTNDSLSATVGPGFMVRDRNGRFASLRALGTTAEVQGSNSVSLNATLTTIQLNGSLVAPNFSPLNDAVALGVATASPARPWGDIVSRGVIYNYGFPATGANPAGPGHYARLAISHTGTNGAIVFDSQSAGSAGAARPFTWATNGVMIAKLQQNEFLLTNSATATVGSMRITSGGHTLLLAGTSGDLFFGVNNNGSGNMILTSTGLVPATDGGLALGSGANGFNSITLNGITKVEKTALTPVEGMMVFQTDNTPGYRFYQNGAWVMPSTVADP